MNLIPKPNTAPMAGHGKFRLGLEILADLSDFSENCLKAFIERTGIVLKKCPPSGSLFSGNLSLNREKGFGHEEYLLEVTPEKTNITAASDNGVMLALVTLYQNIDSQGYIPCFRLRDFPKYRHRGLLLDCVRNFVGVAEVKRVIEQISLLKMNVLHWHLTNDQAWRIECDSFPLLHDGGQFYSKQEIREIIEFAAVRNVQIIPEISMPGHSTAAIRKYPHLSCKGVSPAQADGGGVYRIIMCAGKECTYNFLYTLLDEICELFPSYYIHIGGDEVPTGEWEECPDCNKLLADLDSKECPDCNKLLADLDSKECPDGNKLLADLDSKNYAALNGYFLKRIAEYLVKKGKKPICWNDVLKCGDVSDDLTIQYWFDAENNNDSAQCVNLCNPLIFSDMFNVYLDYPHALIPLRTVYEYIPRVKGKDFSSNDCTLGLEACLWSERIDSENKLEQLLFPRIFALAENAWSIDKDYSDFERRLKFKQEELKRCRIDFTELNSSNPPQSVREQAAVVFYGIFTNFLEKLRKNGVSVYDAYSAADIIERFGIDIRSII